MNDCNYLAVSCLPATKQLHQDGYALLRGAIPLQQLNDLRSAFDAGVTPSEQWPVPRGKDWCHAFVDLVPEVQAVCRLPELLAVVDTLIGERFFLAQVEGRKIHAGQLGFPRSATQNPETVQQGMSIVA